MLLAVSFIAQDVTPSIPPLNTPDTPWLAIVVATLWLVREVVNQMINVLGAKHKFRQEDKKTEFEQATTLFERSQALNTVFGQQLAEVRDTCRRQDKELDEIRRKHEDCEEESRQLKEENRTLARQLQKARNILEREGLLKDKDSDEWPPNPPSPIPKPPKPPEGKP